MTGGSRPAPFGVGFLLSQLGLLSASNFARLVAPLGVTPPHVGLLRAITDSPGRSQQALADEFGMPASRMVVLLDDLEARGLVERRRDPADRRVHLLHATPEGVDLMTRVEEAGKDAERRLLQALSAAERKQLKDLLLRIADDQRLTRGVHPGYRTLRPKSTHAAKG